MRIIIIACLCLLFVGCKNKAVQENISDEQIQVAVDTMLNNVSDVYWSILGTEPFWNIYIHNDTVMFTKLNEKIDTIYFELKQYADSGSVIQYILTDKEENTSALKLLKEQCSDGMSDKTYQYSATFKYKDLELKGCAEKK